MIAKFAEHFDGFDGFRNARRLQKPVALHVLSQADALFHLVHDDEMILLHKFDDYQSGGIRS